MQEMVNSYLVMYLSQGIRRGQKYTILHLHQTRTSSNTCRDIGVPCERQHSSEHSLHTTLSSNLALGN